MASALRLDTEELHDRAAALALLASEFNVADDFADNLEEAVGVHPDTDRLRHEINGFASSWRIRREKVQGSITELHGYIDNVATSFDETDAQLAAGIAGSQQDVDFTGGGNSYV